MPRRTIGFVLVFVVPRGGGAGRVAGHLGVFTEDGTPAGEPEWLDDLAPRVAELERTHRPRWVWPHTADIYPDLLRSGVRVERCHDLALAEGLILNYHGRHGEPRALAAAWARARGLPVPDDPPPVRREDQPTLFEPDRSPLPDGVDPVRAAVTVHGGQQRAAGEVEHPDRMRVLIAAESAGALAAAEMSHAGLPWRADVHEALLAELLGPRPAPGARPARLAELAEKIAAALGGRQVNPDSPASVVRAFAAAGVDVPSTRAWVLREVDHPAVEPLLEYKELARLYAAHGWSWLESWVRHGRFHPEYVVGGVVSGRWATRGGAALQLPRALRSAVRAEPGHVLVVADAAQLEPRVLAALAGDARLAEVAAAGDLYASLAADSFAGDRARAKVAMLSAMYGGSSGGAGPLLAVLRRRFPDAVGYVEAAARTGEQGGLVRSRLGRTSPPPSAAWREMIGGGSRPEADETAQRRSLRAARDWGRFTRNFVVQGSAADWAAALLAVLRRRLSARVSAAELVFFQHDEVLVHCPEAVADAVCAELCSAAEEATRLVFGATPVRFPLDVHVVTCYADAK
ncbi:bifunctional 3'-5' exonuclease/DNA polymerase [Gandjariella thermophila]|uniref:DNA-directed DNA polymerase n=1 Tax=Gandjariella thermophila TaxID=1931992 RepID=A0A4D4J6R7_9PSEU|nr:bifunctional 3'-5' exonuclease/DNA polymerase [Gandjariella thermophila]GDY32301.1 DNA polymerase I [Gandjariella thermophila]